VFITKPKTISITQAQFFLLKSITAQASRFDCDLTHLISVKLLTLVLMSIVRNKARQYNEQLDWVEWELTITQKHCWKLQPRSSLHKQPQFAKWMSINLKFISGWKRFCSCMLHAQAKGKDKRMIIQVNFHATLTSKVKIPH